MYLHLENTSRWSTVTREEPVMPRQCSVCQHPFRRTIETDTGRSQRQLAQLYDLSKSALARHLKSHCPPAAVDAATPPDPDPAPTPRESVPARDDAPGPAREPTCPICTHPQRAAMLKSLDSGVRTSRVATAFGGDPRALARPYQRPVARGPHHARPASR